jgi:hypothetical protein
MAILVVYAARVSLANGAKLGIHSGDGGHPDPK